MHHRTCSHAALFYRDDDWLCDAVANYVAAALRSGAPAVVIGRGDLLRRLNIELHRQHVQGVPFGPERGPLVFLDAEQTLDRLCVRGSPDPVLFNQVIGGALASVAGSGKRIAAYGEMVGILCERGQFTEAVRLEAMWNEALDEWHATLYCGYASSLFDKPEAKPFYAQIRAAHTHNHEATGESLAA